MFEFTFHDFFKNEKNDDFFVFKTYYIDFKTTAACKLITASCILMKKFKKKRK